jgi:hypothetical protein
MRPRGFSDRVLAMVGHRHVGEMEDFAWFTPNDVSILELFEATGSIGSQIVAVTMRIYVPSKK